MVHSNNDSGQKFQLVVNTELEALVPVLQWFEEMSQSRLPDSIIWQVKVALAEGFTNTVRYAHDDLPSTTPIQIELVFLTDNLIISIWNFGQPFEQICDALLEIADGFQEEVAIIYPVHLNPNVKEVAHRVLKRKNIVLISPLEYPELIWMMNKSSIILTDSGGIQEEAPSLGKPVLVLREVTERTEGVAAGTAILVGADREKIVRETKKLLEDDQHYNLISKASNPYGDGTTSEKVKQILAGF